MPSSEQVSTPLEKVKEIRRNYELDSGTAEKPFYTDRDGVSSCRLVGPVKMQDILDRFELPEHYETDDEVISYSKFRSHLHLISKQDYQVILRKRAERKKRFDKRVLASRKGELNAMHSV